jgi:acetyl esterase/lipase
VLVPEAQRLLAKIEALGAAPAWPDVGAVKARQVYDATPDPGHTAEVASVEDLVVDADDHPLPIRVFRPVDAAGPVPTLLWLHGGGWVLGSLDGCDRTCRRLTSAAGCVTVAVDYRLAPEHPFPAGLDDCTAALAWVHEHAGTLGGRPDAIVVGGDSAGGNLTAATALRARDESGPPIALQVLVYPVTDFDPDTPSMHANAEGFLLTRDIMAWFYDQYLPADQRTDPYAAPFQAASLAGLPPALVIVAGHDPLHDEGVAYARRLAADGVPTTLSSYPGHFHGFAVMTRFLADARRAETEIVDAVRRATMDLAAVPA